jgi:hypothetical protein
LNLLLTITILVVRCQCQATRLGDTTRKEEKEMETIQMILDAVNAQSTAVQALQDEIKTLVNALREVTWGGEAGLNPVGSYQMANEVLDRFKGIKYEPVLTKQEIEERAKSALLRASGLPDLPF